ncbi:MAG: PorP/SprF family type IX secretion system membrane protein [Bacteroidales bacterium]|nr:PorP/SprF family type IX secretion system membrane protein [Candidatus Colicola caccequi]MCQ2328309.1 PorP/SprF family type IX secretion system membrane protein [Paludibacteraceae bacterium]
MKQARWIALIILLVVVASTRAQTDPQLGQYMHLQQTYNPAAAGDGDLMRVAGMHRMQFTGISNFPMTTYFTFCSPFVINNTKHAAGVRFLNDMYGLFSNQSFHVQYAYRHKIGNGYLSAGVDLGFVNMSFKTDSINLAQVAAEVGEGGFFSENDPAIPKGSGEKGSNGMTFDMGLGLYYSAPTWWAGISYSHLTRPKVEWSDLSEITLVGTLYIAGGYNWKLKYAPQWVLKPSLMVMTDFVNWDVNLTMLAEWKERVRFGLGYRIAGSVNVLLGVDIVSGLQLGYTFELPANKLIRATYGSHEIYLAYGFNILKPKRTNKYKSVRYL